MIIAIGPLYLLPVIIINYLMLIFYSKLADYLAIFSGKFLFVFSYL